MPGVALLLRKSCKAQQNDSAYIMLPFWSLGLRGISAKSKQTKQLSVTCVSEADHMQVPLSAVRAPGSGTEGKPPT